MRPVAERLWFFVCTLNLTFAAYHMTFDGWKTKFGQPWSDQIILLPFHFPLLYLVQRQATVVQVHYYGYYMPILWPTSLFSWKRIRILGGRWLLQEKKCQHVFILNYHNTKLHMGLWLRLVAWEYYLLVFPDLCLTRMDFHNNEICREDVDKR